MTNDQKLYGLVKKHVGGAYHLVDGRADQARCGAHREGHEWAIVVRGVVTIGYARTIDGICHNCLSE